MNLAEKLYTWMTSELEADERKRLIFGLNGPQGVGKSTLGRELEKMGRENGVSVFSFSIDDFYLTHKDQNALAKQYEQTSFLHQRGYPGTHDIDLGIKILEKLSMGGTDVFVPQYNKSANSGKGDRFSKDKWKLCRASDQIIVFDGWMLGFLSQDSTELEMDVVNTFLKDYEHWWKFLDRFIQLKIENFQWVVEWRVEAEENMKKSGGAGMTTSEVEGYAEKFLPAYNSYTKTLKDFHKNFKSSIVCQINKNRECESCSTFE